LTSLSIRDFACLLSSLLIAFAEMKVAIAQIKPVLGDFKANLEIHVENISRAGEHKADLVIFPELSLTGYTLKDLTSDVALRLDSTDLSPLLKASKKVDIVVGAVEESDEFLFYNSAIYISDGRILHTHRKLYLPTYGMFEEGRHFATGRNLSAFKTRFYKAGILICEDAWHSVCPLILTLKGALVIINLANGTARGIETEKQIASATVWERMNSFYAVNHSAFFVFVNRAGVEDGVSFWGGSEVIDPFGERIIKAPYFEEALVYADIDTDVARRARIKSPLLRDERVGLALREFEALAGRPETGAAGG
jgi:predicted amidohydrolase